MGPSGSVTGIDMTDEQLKTARENVDAWMRALGYTKPNLSFVKGELRQGRAKS